MKPISVKKYIAVVCAISLIINVVGIIYIRNLVQKLDTAQYPKQTYNQTLQEVQTGTQYSFLQDVLSEEEIVYIMQRQLSYQLTVNGEPFYGSTMYITDQSNICISLMQIDKSNGSLDRTLLDKGMLCSGEKGDELTDHITVASSLPYQLIKEEKGNNIKYSYQYNGVSEGTIITIQIDDLIQSRLELSKDIKGDRMQIIVK